MENNHKDRTVFENWKTTMELANFILDQEGLYDLEEWGGREVMYDILPEGMLANFDMVQPALVDTIIKEKNRPTAAAFCKNMLDYTNFMLEGLDSGKPLCYNYFAISVELCFAMGIMPICYELICGLTAALYTKGCEEGIDRIEAEGYPDHLCSTQKGTAGFLLMGVIPKPDILLKPTTPCDPSNKMYEWTAHKLGIPLVAVESPYYRDERSIKYLVDDTKRMIEAMEKLTGNTLDEDKLREHVGYGNEAVEYFIKIQELKKNVPCPDTGWHRPADTIFLTGIGTPMSAAYFKDVYEVVKATADKGEGVIPEGKKEKRFAWGYTWECYDLPLFDWLEEEHGVTYMADTLTYFDPDVGLVDTSSVETMIEDLAWRVINMPMGRQSMTFSDMWINDFETVVKGHKADALILGGNMACKHYWALNKLMSDKIKEKTGVPCLRFELDMFDKRFTPPAELRRIVGEFVETTFP